MRRGTLLLLTCSLLATKYEPVNVCIQGFPEDNLCVTIFIYKIRPMYAFISTTQLAGTWFLLVEKYIERGEGKGDICGSPWMHTLTQMNFNSPSCNWVSKIPALLTNPSMVSHTAAAAAGIFRHIHENLSSSSTGNQRVMRAVMGME